MEKIQLNLNFGSLTMHDAVALVALIFFLFIAVSVIDSLWLYIKQLIRGKDPDE